MTVRLDCIACSVPFWVSDQFDARRREDKKTFYCPWGHPQAYIKSEADRLREELALAKKRVETAKQREAQYEDELLSERRRAAAARGQTTRLRNRVAAGVCPCCNRTFANLARHIAGQHPTFTSEP